MALIGIRRALIKPKAPTAVVAGLDPATVAWVNAVGVAGVSPARQTVVDTFIKALKSASLWGTFDRYWLLAGENATQAKIDLVNLQSLTIVGAPTFAPNQGYTSTSTSNYVDTNYVPSTSAVHYGLNSAVFGGFVNSSRVTGGNVFEYGTSDSGFTNIASFNAFSAASNLEVRVNSTSPDPLPNTVTRGAWTASRTGASAGQLYYNGSTSSPGSPIIAASTALPNASFFIGLLNLGGPFGPSNDQISSFFTAGGWNGTQAANFYSAERAMLTSVGLP